MKKDVGLKKILEHPDLEEIISKLLIGVPSKEIYAWLKSKYTNVSESKFVIAEKSLVSFQNNYLDIYNHIKEDLLKTQQNQTLPLSDQASLAVRDNKTYKDKMLQLAENELDIKSMLGNMIVAIETRAAQVFDEIQEDPRNMRMDRVLIEWFDTLGSTLEKYHKLVIGGPDQIVQHNVNIQTVDKYSDVFIEAIKDTLSEMGIEYSLKFMELYSEKLNKLKPASEANKNIETRLTEAKIINETITNKLNEN